MLLCPAFLSVHCVLWQAPSHLGGEAGHRLLALGLQSTVSIARVVSKYYGSPSLACSHEYSRSFCLGLIPLGEGDGTPLQYSCLENPMDGGAW